MRPEITVDEDADYEDFDDEDVEYEEIGYDDLGERRPLRPWPWHMLVLAVLGATCSSLLGFALFVATDRTGDSWRMLYLAPPVGAAVGAWLVSVLWKNARLNRTDLTCAAALIVFVGSIFGACIAMVTLLSSAYATFPVLDRMTGAGGASDIDTRLQLRLLYPFYNVISMVAVFLLIFWLCYRWVANSSRAHIE
jgi:hypothetical protein